MYLYLVQHGEAKREDEDPERGLTEKGVSDVRRVAGFVSRIPLKPVRIYHSTKTRARQTATIFAEFLSPSKGLIEIEGVSPLDDPQVWVDGMDIVSEEIMLVGHLPHLARLTTLLLSGDKGGGAVDFKMGGLVCLGSNETGKWRLEWMVVPDIIR